MADYIRIKRRVTGGSGAPSPIYNAELAYNEVDDTLYYGKGLVPNDFADYPQAIGGPGAFVTLDTTQTVSGDKTFSGTLNLLAAEVLAPTPVSSDNSSKLATTEFVKVQNYLKANQRITITGDAEGSGTSSIELTLAEVVTAGEGIKITYNSKGLVTGATVLQDSDIPVLTVSKLSDFDATIAALTLNHFEAPTASLDLGGQLITALATPVSSTDAATKGYVDALSAGFDFKDSVVAASTTNLTLSGQQTVDGVALVNGDRVLVVAQSDQTENGIYVVSSGAWTRAIDADNASPIGVVTSGLITYVEEGTFNGESQWVLATTGEIELGVTPLNFVLFSGLGMVEAGSGLTKSENVINVGGTTDRITVSADAVDIASTYVGQSSIITVGTITTGTWEATTLALDYGGTGADLSALSDGSILKKSGTSVVAAVSGTDYNVDATTTSKGVVQLNTATNSTSETEAATPSAVKQAYDLAGAAVSATGNNLPLTHSVSSSAVYAASTTSLQTILSLDATVYRSVKFMVQVVNATSYQATELICIHDGVTCFLSAPVTVFSVDALATFTATISAGQIQLEATPTYATTDFKIVYQGIKV